MVREASWNKYEKVILVDAWNQAHEGKITPKEAITNVSKKLRQMAVNSGIKIDKSYRNEPGIVQQMRKLEYAASNGKAGTKPNSEWFWEYIRMFREDSEKYEYVLKEAKRKVSLKQNTTLTVELNEDETRFKEWLKINHPNYVDKIFSTFQTVDRYLQEWHVIDQNLLQIKEIGQIDLIIRQVRYNSGIQFIHKRDQQLFVVVLSAYRNYLNEQEKAQPTSDVVENQDDQKNEIEKSDKVQQSTEENKDEKEETAKEDTPPDKISFKEWLIDVQGKGVNTANSYNRTICDAETYAKENQIGYGVIQNPNHPYQVKETIKALFDDDKFKSIDKREYHRFYDALHQYRKYLGLTPFATQLQIRDKMPSQPKETPEASSDQHQEERIKFKDDNLTRKDKSNEANDSLYREVLSQYFATGFRISSILDMKRFRNNWAKNFGSDNTETDDNIRKIIERITLQYNDLVYLPEQMLDQQTAEKIIAYLKETFENGRKVVYYAALFDHFENELLNSHINTPDMLKSYLINSNQGGYYFHNQFMTKYDYVSINFIKEISDYLIEMAIPVTVDELKKEFSNLPEKKITYTLRTNHNEGIIRNQTGEYFHANIVEFSKEEIDQIKRLIGQSIEDKGFMSGNELIESIQRTLPDVAEQYNFLSMVGFRDAIGYKLRKKFNFRGNIISEYGKELSMADVFARYGKSHKKFTLEDLNTLKSDLKTTIYFDDLYENAIRVSQDEFVSKDQINFDIKETDAAIERFCTGDYVPLAEVDFFGTFPSVGFRWNRFLLEQYVAFYSKEFKLLHSNFNANSAVGAIVKRSSGINNFDELIEIELTESGILLRGRSALNHLVDRGLLARRSYSKIKKALLKAKVRRSQKG